MAKVAFSKLGLKIDNEVNLLSWGEYEIEVRKYLPIGEKADMISRIINLSVDDNGYYNPLRVKIYFTLETLFYYTNISFTEKQKENVYKLYDMILSSGLFEQIIKLIPIDEWKDLQNSIWHTISNIYEYRNSIMGVMDTIATDYSALDMDAKNINASLSNPENLKLLRDVLTKLG